MQVLQTLLDGVRSTCAGFPDKRRGSDVTYSMADIGLSAFSLFFMQSESFLSYQRGLEEGRKTSNCQSLFGMKAIPTDNHIRAMLDPVDPSHLQPAFDDVLGALRRHGGLAPFQRLGGRVLIALDSLPPDPDPYRGHSNTERLASRSVSRIDAPFGRYRMDLHVRGGAWSVRRQTSGVCGRSVAGVRVQSKRTLCVHRLAKDRNQAVQFGRFLANPAVTTHEMLVTTGRLSNQRAAGRHVLVIMDTTDLRFPTHEASKRGFGRDDNDLCPGLT